MNPYGIAGWVAGISAVGAVLYFGQGKLKKLMSQVVPVSSPIACLRRMVRKRGGYAVRLLLYPAEAQEPDESDREDVRVCLTQVQVGHTLHWELMDAQKTRYSGSNNNWWHTWLGRPHKTQLKCPEGFTPDDVFVTGENNASWSFALDVGYEDMTSPSSSPPESPGSVSSTLLLPPISTNVEEDEYPAQIRIENAGRTDANGLYVRLSTRQEGRPIWQKRDRTYYISWLEPNWNIRDAKGDTHYCSQSTHPVTSAVWKRGVHGLAPSPDAIEVSNELDDVREAAVPLQDNEKDFLHTPYMKLADSGEASRRSTIASSRSSRTPTVASNRTPSPQMPAIGEVREGVPIEEDEKDGTVLVLQQDASATNTRTPSRSSTPLRTRSAPGASLERTPPRDLNLHVDPPLFVDPQDSCETDANDGNNAVAHAGTTPLMVSSIRVPTDSPSPKQGDDSGQSSVRLLPGGATSSSSDPNGSPKPG